MSEVPLAASSLPTPVASTPVQVGDVGGRLADEP
jgi:hypothetical protein